MRNGTWGMWGNGNEEQRNDEWGIRNRMRNGGMNSGKVGNEERDSGGIGNEEQRSGECGMWSEEERRNGNDKQETEKLGMRNRGTGK